VVRALRGITLAAALACVFVCFGRSSAEARTVKQKKQAAAKQLDVADRLREDLLGTKESDRDHGDYQKVIDAYRKVYYTAPSYAKADAAVLAVAELLDEQGRVLDDAKSLKDSIGQLNFLRREYPGSRHRVEALFTIGEIYRDDLHDADKAKAAFQEYLKRYPHSTLAPRATQALADIADAENGKAKSVRAKRGQHAARNAVKTQAKAAWPDARPSKPNADRAASDRTASDRNTDRASKSEPRSNKRASQAPEDSPAASDEAAAVPQAESKAQQQDSSYSKIPPPSASGHMPRLTAIRHWSTPDYVRVVIDLEQEVKYDVGRVPKPDRIFFDLYGTKLSQELAGKTFAVEAGFLHRIRVAQYKVNMARVVLDVDDVAEYSAFLLPNPYRLIIDIHGKLPATQIASTKTPRSSETRSQDVKPDLKPDSKQDPKQQATSRDPKQSAEDNGPDVTVTQIKPATQLANGSNGTKAAVNSRSAQPKPTPVEVAKADPPRLIVYDNTMDSADASKTTTKPTTGPTYEAVAPKQSSRNKKSKVTSNDSGATPNGHAAAPAANGERSLIRALGLKIGRIVVDAGHGGHDTGTIGPNGLEEKDLVLDVALKLGKLLEDKLGAEVVYTRDDDTFIPLETRTAIANKEQADLFISIHANSSSDQTARGVETYYLNFTSSRDALEVAARENAVSEKSIHELQDLVKKIALKEKIEESREFAADVQKSLYTGLNAKNPGIRNRGVKKAPFIVLIGANMPSILAEISFVSNPGDEKKLKTGDYRQRIADSLYKGVAKYINGLSGVKVASRVNRDSLRSSAAVAAK